MGKLVQNTSQNYEKFHARRFFDDVPLFEPKSRTQHENSIQH